MSSKPATSRVNVGCTEDKKKECEKNKIKVMKKQVYVKVSNSLRKNILIKV